MAFTLSKKKLTMPSIDLWKFSLVTALMINAIFIHTTEAQLMERSDYPFVVAGEPLTYPMAGGLNAPQFSTGHFNGDNLEDLLVYDRGGQIGMIFAKQADGSYLHDTELSDRLPSMKHWALARDFDGDGVIDLFSQSSPIPGICVFRGIKNASGVTFEKIRFPGQLQVITYETASGNATNVFSANTDIPALEDVDGDGDLDILSFESGGSFVSYFRNTSIQDGFGADSLHFVLEDECWGKFIESALTNDVNLSQDPDRCANATTRSGSGLHSGSTIGAIDIDQDNDLDLFLGDLSFSNVVALTNGGTAERAYIDASEPAFPPGGAIDIRFFPATFFVDLDDDGLPEMLAAPNEKDSRQRDAIVYLYKPAAGTEGLNYSLDRTHFLHDEMLDFGTESFPLFIDIDGDGLLDILVGSRYDLTADLNTPGSLFLFRNVGNISEPAFELIDSNYLNLKSISGDQTDALAPVAHDMDGDGDQDLIIGNKVGKLYFVENTSSGTFFTADKIQYPWFDIDVGFSSYPAIHDINQDGLPDLLLGEEIGNINYFENIGTAGDPGFIPDSDQSPNNKNFGLIDSRQGASVFGFSTPTVVKTVDATQLVVGSKIGTFLLYTLDSSNNNNPVQQVDHPLGKIRDGERSKVQFSDLDDDGYFEMMTGNGRGGIVGYETTFRSKVVSTSKQYTPAFAVTLSPNPTRDFIYIKSVEKILKLRLYDATGRLIKEIYAGDQAVHLSDQPAGIYFLEVNCDKGIVVKKVIKN